VYIEDEALFDDQEIPSSFLSGGSGGHELHAAYRWGCVHQLGSFFIFEKCEAGAALRSENGFQSMRLFSSSEEQLDEQLQKGLSCLFSAPRALISHIMFQATLPEFLEYVNFIQSLEQSQREELLSSVDLLLPSKIAQNAPTAKCFFSKIGSALLEHLQQEVSSTSLLKRSALGAEGVEVNPKGVNYIIPFLVRRDPVLRKNFFKIVEECSLGTYTDQEVLMKWMLEEVSLDECVTRIPEVLRTWVYICSWILTNDLSHNIRKTLLWRGEHKVLPKVQQILQQSDLLDEAQKKHLLKIVNILNRGIYGRS